MRDGDWVELDRDQFDWAFRSGVPCQVYYGERWRAAWLYRSTKYPVDPWCWRIDPIDRYDLNFGFEIVARVPARYWSHWTRSAPLDAPPTDQEIAEAIESIRSAHHSE